MPARIFKSSKSTMQSGQANMQKWYLQFEAVNCKFVDPVMGWTASTDPIQQIELSFNSLTEAIEYAKRNNINYNVIESNPSPIRPKSYAANFTNRQ